MLHWHKMCTLLNMQRVSQSGPKTYCIFTTVWPLKITTASSLVAAHQITTHVSSIAEIRGCKVSEHKNEVSSSVWAKNQIMLRCLEGLDEAVLQSVSKVNEVIFNRELNYLAQWSNWAGCCPSGPNFTQYWCNTANRKKKNKSRYPNFMLIFFFCITALYC